MRDPADLRDRLDGPDLVVCGHHRDEDGPVGDRVLDVARVNAAELVDREIGDPAALLLERPAGVENRVVLDRGGDDMVPALPEGCRHPLDRPVVSLTAAGGKGDLLRLRPKGRRNPGPGLFHALPGRMGKPVERRGVAKIPGEIRGHRREDLGFCECRRRVVHVHGALILIAHIGTAFDLELYQRYRSGGGEEPARRGTTPRLTGTISVTGPGAERNPPASSKKINRLPGAIFW